MITNSFLADTVMTGTSKPSEVVDLVSSDDSDETHVTFASAFKQMKPLTCQKTRVVLRHC